MSDPETIADDVCSELDDAIAGLTLDDALEATEMVLDAITARMSALEDDRRRRDSTG